MKTKKANITYIVSVIIISIISFFIYLAFFSSISNVVSTNAADLSCNTLIATKGNGVVKVAEFFSSIDKKCQKDDMTIKSDSKEEIYKTLGDRMVSCWQRYGKGEYDFMSNVGTDGNWCFTCGKVSFSDKGGVYDYNDFIDWTQKNNIKSKDKQVSYYDSISMKYSDFSNEVIENMSVAMSQIQDLKEDPDYSELMLSLTNQYQYLYDLALKKIDTNDDIYIVYRYDRWDKSNTDLALTTAEGVAAGLGAGIATNYAASLVVGFFTGGPIGLGISAIKIVAKAGSTAKKIEKVQKVLKVLKIMSKAVKISTVVGAAVAGGEIGYNYNTNNVQYVDLLTREQYYRMCGTEPKSFN